ncbi:GGDEF domain-containing protein [Parerythrobacter jejuensis]|uniref:Diguanylate cyclase n=1 Tax=Parerythrobacter jejuensis TaxID=795812 RepID=A0A845AUQ7_9SPHN|nr:sensor domain-containing diguanylate cyclase [Parerythrobacter jejuensis]MXP31330.1 diguanylate cyclase [Parerythrobacter jejuensis]MXP34090.1 diguanylate cyclase [Parerythrobacter jejuensis]
MGLDFAIGELAALCEMVAGGSTDILLKTDNDGFIVCASQNIAFLGAPMPDLLVPPNLLDLVAPHHVHRVQAELALVAAGNGDRNWVEFECAHGPEAGHWFALKLQPCSRRAGGPNGTIGVLRNVEERRRLEDKLFAARMTDPLTGLTNRIAFLSMLRHMAEHRRAGCLALFRIEHFRAINHRLGQDFGDDVLAAFGQVLRTVLRQRDILSRIGDASFAVLLPDSGETITADLCTQVQDVFADEIRAGKAALPLSAAAGVAEIGVCADETLRRAEMAAFLDRTNGSTRQSNAQVRPRPPLRPFAAPMPSRPHRLAG